MNAETWTFISLVSAFSIFILGIILAEKSDRLSYSLICLGVSISILIICAAVIQMEYNMQKEIYDKTVFQPWVKSLDSKSCEELGDAILKQKLLENQTAIEAGLKAFNSKECHFDISSGQVLELLK